MKNYIKYIFPLMLLLTVTTVRAQVSAIIDLNRKSVYVQQPFHVTVTVYTRTWFTAPLEFGNLQIPNAFIIPFDKTQPGMFDISGKKYPGVQFYYIVFPYKPGNFTVPSLQITAQSPPEGSSQAQKIIIETKPQPFEVKDVPTELKDKGAWFVAKGVTLHELWTPPGHSFKVGDVVKRAITIDAQGTLPQFIPDLSGQESLDWAASYPQDPVLTDTRSAGDANGRSTQTITYLMEKTGDYTIPEVSVSYWNPTSAKIVVQTIPALQIHVDENPNLGILATLRDSLNSTVQAKPVKAGEKAPFLILGMKWYTFAGCVLAIFTVLYILFRIGKKIYKNLRTKRENYLKSEAYLFRRFQHSKGHPKEFLPALYRWWDNFDGKPSASVNTTLESENATSPSKAFTDYYKNALQGDVPAGAATIKEALKQFRKKGKKVKGK